MAFTVQIGRREIDRPEPTLVVGTHASCDLVIDDPLAARHHARLVARGSELFVEPIGVTTGVFVDGARIDGSQALVDGSDVIVGTSVLTFRGFDREAGRHRIEVNERGFYHVEKRRGEFRSDADERVRHEVRFGRIGPLRVFVALALLAAALGLSWAWGRDGESTRVFASPGPLVGAHGELFRAASVGAGADGFAAALMDEAQKGCFACHVERGADGAPQPSGFGSGIDCSGCHAEFLEDLRPGGRHPFELGEGSSCVDCHRVHGAHDEFVNHRGRGAACTECHGDAAADVRAEVTSFREAGGPVPPRSQDPTGLTFQHKQHGSMDCTACHAAERGGQSYSVPDVTVACFGCHGDDAVAADVPFRAPLTLAEHAQGGRLCEECHESATDSRMARALRAVATPTITVAPAHHAGGRDCSECHLRPLEPRSTSSAFDHARHGLIGSKDDATCQQCHAGVREAQDLAAVHMDVEGTLALRSECTASCHSPEAGGVEFSLRFEPGSEEERLGPRSFSHAAHSGVGCAECHGPIGARDGDGLSPAADCARCHYENGEHQHAPRIAACTQCHREVPGERGGLHALAGWSAAPKEPRSARNSGFSHAIEPHQRDCSECHGWEPLPDGLERARLIQGKVCWDCHEVMRFHWR